MGRYKIPADAWRTATLALLRYQESKAELDECIRDSMAHDPETRGRGAKQAHPDPTQAAALRLDMNYKYQRIKREIKAVEAAIADLREEELEVIRRRYWSHSKGHRHPCPYEYMQGLGYERAQMQRISRRVIIKIAASLGEI